MTEEDRIWQQGCERVARLVPPHLVLRTDKGQTLYVVGYTPASVFLSPVDRLIDPDRAWDQRFEVRVESVVSAIQTGVWL